MTIGSNNGGSNNGESSKAEPRSNKAEPGLRVRVRKQTAIVSRWLHLYLSMVSFGVVLFFAATGLTLNHPDWFASHERTTHYKGVVSAALLGGTDGEPDKLGIVELLRKERKIQGAVADFQADDRQITVSFKGPAYAADGFIDRSTGAYEVTEIRSGFVAVMNDLHKGRDTGKVWAWVIDVSAVLLVLVSVSGLVLLWFVYKRRVSGVLLALVGGAVCVVVYRVFVP